MNLKDRTKILAAWGVFLERDASRYEAVRQLSFQRNAWFLPKEIDLAKNAIVHQYLSEGSLSRWLKPYDLNPSNQKEVGLIVAGNIPFVGFHDLLCVLASGHRAKLKISQKDALLIPWMLEVLKEVSEELASHVTIVDRLENFDAVIATGSDSTAKHFDFYFKSYPHIIRRNRNAVAVLTEKESKDQLLQLRNDVYQYFGLGCRSVSKIYVPKDYNFEDLLELWQLEKPLTFYNKYKNNYDYNLTLLIMNKKPYWQNQSVILVERERIASRIAELNFEYYDSLPALEKELQSKIDEIQCIVTDAELPDTSTVNFGEAQRPNLWDYADGVDTLKFLEAL